jgi:hypothetical protein
MCYKDKLALRVVIFFTKSSRLDFVLYFLDNKNVVMDLTRNASNMSELFMFGYLNYYYLRDFMFLSMWLYSPQSVLILFYFCLVKVVRVVSIKLPSPN